MFFMPSLCDLVGIFSVECERKFFSPLILMNSSVFSVEECKINYISSFILIDSSGFSMRSADVYIFYPSSLQILHCVKLQSSGHLCCYIQKQHMNQAFCKKRKSHHCLCLFRDTSRGTVAKCTFFLRSPHAHQVHRPVTQRSIGL